MSKADKMFEKLGYSNENQMSDDIILYEKPDYSYNEELKTLKDLHKKYIKSIVTKEQFDIIKYEVKDE